MLPNTQKTTKMQNTQLIQVKVNLKHARRRGKSEKMERTHSVLHVSHKDAQLSWTKSLYPARRTMYNLLLW